jgi:hypothetical protein
VFKLTLWPGHQCFGDGVYLQSYTTVDRHRLEPGTHIKYLRSKDFLWGVKKVYCVNGVKIRRIDDVDGPSVGIDTA